MAATLSDRTQSTRLRLRRTQRDWPLKIRDPLRPHKRCSPRQTPVSANIMIDEMSKETNINTEFTALNSPAKPRTATKYDPTNGNRTVSGTSGIIPRRSTTLYEKTSSTEKTNVIPAETKYVRVKLVLIISSSLSLKVLYELPSYCLHHNIPHLAGLISCSVSR